MAPSSGRRGPARGTAGGDRSARSLRALAAEAERVRSTPDELARLLKAAAAGDEAATKRVFDENLAMVLRHAQAQAERSDQLLSEDDLLQEGSMALMLAIRSYAADGVDGTRATGFAGYAEAQVVAMLTAALDEQARVGRQQRQLIEDAEAYERAEIAIRRDKQREATIAELAEKLEWPPEKTRLLGEMVAEARRQHDEELLQYIDPDELAELDDD